MRLAVCLISVALYLLWWLNTNNKRQRDSYRTKIRRKLQERAFFFESNIPGLCDSEESRGVAFALARHLKSIGIHITPLRHSELRAHRLSGSVMNNLHRQGVDMAAVLDINVVNGIKLEAKLRIVHFSAEDYEDFNFHSGIDIDSKTELIDACELCVLKEIWKNLNLPIPSSDQELQMQS